MRLSYQILKANIFHKHYNDHTRKRPGFKKDEHNLKPVHCESSAGFIYINVDAAETPERPWKPVGELLDSYMAPFDLKNAKVAHETRIVEGGNWKVLCVL
jgi:Rieske 2Fe-2S family protein